METNHPLSDLSKELAAAVETGGRSVVSVHGRPRVPSSGVMWRDGVVVTTDHTLKRDEDVTVTLPDGKDVPATVAGRDGGTDLAVLRVEGTLAPKLADAASLQVGNLVLALGRRIENGITATFGIVSSLAGEWRTWRGGQVDRFIRPDTSIYTGFSGGALVDAEGSVIGINTSALTRGVGVTIPVATVNRVVEELLTGGRVRRGYLGVGLHPVEVPGSKTGLIVLSLEPDGPAAKHGIVLGDVLLAIDGQAVEDTEDVQKHLRGDLVGKPLPIDLLRGGQPLQVSVVPGERR